MAGKHSDHPWRDLGLGRRIVAVLGILVGGVVRFLGKTPEWQVGLVLTATAVAILLILTG